MSFEVLIALEEGACLGLAAAAFDWAFACFADFDFFDVLGGIGKDGVNLDGQENDAPFQVL